MATIAKLVDQAYEGKELVDLAEAPIDALQGLSAADAQALQQAFAIKTVRQLAQSKFVKIAQAITALADA